MLLLSLPCVVVCHALEVIEATVSMWQIPEREPIVIMLEEEPPGPVAEAA
jgi:hypothetical protein